MNLLIGGLKQSFTRHAYFSTTHFPIANLDAMPYRMIKSLHLRNHERESFVHPGIKVASTLIADIGKRILFRPGLAIGPVGSQRVPDINYGENSKRCLTLLPNRKPRITPNPAISF
jgi:hypothetical protein